jgi:hypothetical protein
MPPNTPHKPPRRRLESAQFKGIREVVTQEVMELLDTGYNTDPEWVVWSVLKFHPEVGSRCSVQLLLAIAEQVLYSEIPEQSEKFQNLFEQVNDHYFGGQLPDYRVRVAYDVHRVSAEPPWHTSDSETELISDGVIRFDERVIYLRYTECDPNMMLDVLVHVMCHAATAGEHDKKWMTKWLRVYKVCERVN